MPKVWVVKHHLESRSDVYFGQPCAATYVFYHDDRLIYIKMTTSVGQREFSDYGQIIVEFAPSVGKNLANYVCVAAESDGKFRRCEKS